MRVEEKYEDVLQNIESGIISVFRKYPDINDYGVMRALDAAIKYYQSEYRGHEPKPVRLAEKDKLIFEQIKAMCEYRLGRNSELMPKENTGKLDIHGLTVEEILTCLRKIRKSVDRWNKRGGRQGYLTFVSQFIK